MDFDPLFQVLGKFVIVAQIFFGENQHVHFGSPRGDQLFFHAADRQHRPVSVNLSCHAEIFEHRLCSRRSERSAVTMVIPAEGPSFGVAPSGMWICTCDFSKKVMPGAYIERHGYADSSKRSAPTLSSHRPLGPSASSRFFRPDI